ncbi:Nitrogen assimilation transcription factor nirA [Paramyrothecium foliicola]|nr:Nitrogen assimilation transcription factor nirA [Paramyrothecium foliicola]
MRRQPALLPAGSSKQLPPLELTPRFTSVSQKRKLISAACEACRRRKSKCSAERPTCDQCLKIGTDCVYETRETETVQQARRRKLDEAVFRSDAFEKLYQYLRTKTEDEAAVIVRKLREGIDIDSLLRHVEDGDLLLQVHLVPNTFRNYELPYGANFSSLFNRPSNPYYHCTLSSGITFDSFGGQPEQEAALIQDVPDHDKPYYIPYHGARIIDARIESIKARDWTNVVCSDRTYRELIHNFFLYEHSFYPALHKDLFLDDLANRRHQYCSPLLVNAVLASACHGCSSIMKRAEFWHPQTLHYQFLAEAKRLWELETQSKLTTIQAATILGRIYDTNCCDKASWAYFAQGFAMAREMKLFDRTSVRRSKDMQKARDITAWGLFAFESMASFYYYQAPSGDCPLLQSLPDPDEAAEYYGEIWVKYPLAQTLVPIRMGECILANLRLQHLTYVIAVHLFPKVRNNNTRWSLDQARRFYSQLRAWYAELPSSFSPAELVFPPQILLLVQYYNILCTLFDPFTTQTPRSESPPNNTLQIRYLIEEETDAGSKLPVNQTPEEIVTDAKICLETLMHLFYRRHSFESFFTFALIGISQMGFEAVKRISEPHTDPALYEAMRATVVLCGKGLRDLHNNFYLAEVVLRVYCDSLRPQDQNLLLQFSSISEEAERKALVAKHAHTAWPGNIIDITRNPKEDRVDNLIKAHARLSLDPPPEAPAEAAGANADWVVYSHDSFTNG